MAKLVRKSKSPRRKSPKAKSPRRKSPKVKSSRRKSPKVKSSIRKVQSPKFKMSSIGRCEPSNLKKYINRGSPPYPAQNCRNHKKVGNDGDLYSSEPDKNGIYKWKKL